MKKTVAMPASVEMSRASSRVYLLSSSVLLILLAVGLLSYLRPVPAERQSLTVALEAENSHKEVSHHYQTAERGKAIFENISKKYPAVQPIAWAVATKNPRIALFLPAMEWAELSKEDQVSLTLYIESLIPAIRANPNKYVAEFRIDPLYNAFRTKVANLCADCWVVGVGRLTIDNKGALFDEVVVQGDSAWEKSDPRARGVKASAFRQKLNSVTLARPTPVPGPSAPEPSVLTERGSAREMGQEVTGGQEKAEGKTRSSQPSFDERGAKRKEDKTAVTDPDNLKGETAWEGHVKGVNRPPKIAAASPRADSLEIAIGNVQRFSVTASDPDKDDQLAYTWFLDGQEVARGRRWEFRAPSTPAAETRRQVEIEVSDKGGLKDRVAWNIALKIPSPPPYLVDAQPRDKRVVLQVGESLDFSVVADLPGSSDEARKDLRYQWSVEGAPPQTTQIGSFRFIETTPATYQLTAIAVSPEGLKSAPWRWTIEVRPPEVTPPPPLSLSEEEIQAWLDAQQQAWEAKNVGRLVELGAVSDQDAARARTILATYKSFNVALQDVDIRIEGSRAAVTFSRVDTIDGQTVPHPDRKVFTLEKEANGRLIARLQ